MEIALVLLLFLIVGFIIFLFMKKVDVFIEECRNTSLQNPGNGENEIRIICENPMMLSYVLEKAEQQKEFEQTSFYFYTGSREAAKRALTNEICDIALFLAEPENPEGGEYQRKSCSFTPNPFLEARTGVEIEPVERQKTRMYVLWKEKNVTEIEHRMISIL